MLEQLLQWDQGFFLFLNQMGSNGFDPFWILLSKRGMNVVVYLFLVILYGRKFGSPLYSFC